MASFKSYFIFLVLISYLMISGLYLFINGFFLTRIARMERNNCTPCHLSDTCNPELILQDPENAAQICLEPRARVVLLIVDALKYEFMEWHENFYNLDIYYKNQLPIIHELLKKYPNNTRMYKSIADPPTTTMQRLKAMTTGTLPTFIDISSNFATDEIKEDNIIDQAAPKGIVFMGDDTWTSLHPGKYLRQFPSASFNVWDLDTVDRDVKNRIFFELQKKDWSLLIAHTLGVDHCGHKHGQNHPEMARKLNETNTLIKEIIEVIDDKTVLIVVGDHGMTESGDHGGDSPNEVEAGLFVYSKLNLQNLKTYENSTELHQIDLVPTLSTILGVPIPFSNLGAVILDIIPSKSTYHDFWYSIHALWRNIHQTKQYIDVYSSESFLFSDQKLGELDKHYKSLMNEVRTINENEEDLMKFMKHAKEYSNNLREACIEIWIQFDANWMLKGLLLMFCTLFAAYFVINYIPQDYLNQHRVLNDWRMKILVISNCLILVVMSYLYFMKYVDEFKKTTLMLTSSMTFFLSLAITVVEHWGIISSSAYNNVRLSRFNYFSRIILLLTFFGLFSNSYIVEENKVLTFLLITIVWLLIYDVYHDSAPVESTEKRFKSTKMMINSYKYKTMMVMLGILICSMIRLSSYFWRCREEQDREFCDTTFTGKIGSISGFERFLLIISLVSLALFISVARIWLRNCGNLSGLSMSTAVSRYCPVVVVVCVGSFWVLQRLPKNAKVKFVLAHQMDALPSLAYFFTTFSIVTLLIQPLQVYLLPQRNDTFNLCVGEDIVPKLFDKIKELFSSKKHDDRDDIPIVYGLATVYSAAFLSVSVFIVLLYALLLGSVLASSTFLIVVTCTAVLTVVAIERIKNSNSLTEFFQIPTSAIICWFLIAEYFFYGTGHQPTFPTIHWDAAFIGTRGFFYNNVVPAILIGINTFGSYIILGFLLPLLVIVPFTIYIMFPKIVKTKFPMDYDMRRGELILFYKYSHFRYAIFSVCGRYLLIHGLRTFGCMLAATIHCRHLMTWKIFAPKLIFEGLSFLVSVGSVLMAVVMVMRIEYCVGELINRVSDAENKKMRQLNETQ